jgi:glycosyltransferase involved in cell wall biosynthesis
VRLLAGPLQVAHAVLARRAALVHVNTAFTLRAFWRDLGYAILAKLCGARVVWQVHGGALPQVFCRGRRLAAAFVRWVLHLPDAVVVLSDADREAFRSFGGARRLLALPNGIDCAPYAALRHDSPTPDRALRLLYLGRLVREKGLYELLEGLVLAQRQGVTAELVVAGDGPEAAELRRAAAAHGLERVSFAGAVDGRGKQALLEWADVLALPSYAEGLPYALLESMAAGVPAIATRVGAIPEVVADGTNGLLIEPRSPQAVAGAILRLDRDRPSLALLGEASRATIAARYSIDRLAAELGSLYADLGIRGVRPDVARA